MKTRTTLVHGSPRPDGSPAPTAAKGGFTLIELLVVIAIISLLVSVLMPSLSRARDLAKATICASNLHTLGFALNMFAEDNDERFPPRSTPYRYPDWGRVNTDWAHWMGAAWRNGYMSTYWPIYLGYVWKKEYFDPTDAGAQVLSCPLNERYNHTLMTAPEGTGNKPYCSYWYAPAKLDDRRVGMRNYHTRSGVGDGMLVWDAQSQWHGDGGFNALQATGAVRFFDVVPPNAWRRLGGYSEMDWDTPWLVDYYFPHN